MARLLTPTRIFAAGEQLPVELAEALAFAGGAVAGRMRLPGLEQWRTNVADVVGLRMDDAHTRELARHWGRNNLWSMSLGRWDDRQVLGRVEAAPHVVEHLRTSLEGPGLILALPHMGSWDLAGAWCARVGVQVVSVAERLPAGLYERFRDARARMGMIIHAADERRLVDQLAEHVEARRAVCLLSDRDLSRHGVEVRWPTGQRTTVPPGPALLARRTGADLRVVTSTFTRRGIALRVSDPVDASGDITATMQAVTTHFAADIAAHPTHWLALQPMVRRAAP